jgi:poly(A) polymerase
LVTGKDVLGMGFAPGPLIGKILAAVEEAQLNGELATKETAISFIESKFWRKEVRLNGSGH